MKLTDSSDEALKKANLLTLDDKRKVHDAVYVHKALSGKLPEKINQKYQKQQSLKPHRSAERQMLNIPKHKLENYKHSPLYRTITAWNTTPIEIRNTETTTFKKNLQAHILKKQH